MKTIRALWFKPSPRTLNTHRTRHTTCLLGGKSPVFRAQWGTGGAGTPQFKWQGLSNGKKIYPPLKFLGLQTKPKELPGPKFNPQKTPVPSHKNFQEALNDITIMNLQIVFNTQNNPYLNQTAQKIFAKIFLSKQIPKSKISKRNPLIIPVRLDIESIPPSPARWGLERASQHLRICNCLLNGLESNSR